MYVTWCTHAAIRATHTVCDAGTTARLYRSVLLQGLDSSSVSSHADTVYDRLHTESKRVQEAIEAKRRAKEEAELAECTFAPRTNVVARRGSSQDPPVCSNACVITGRRSRVASCTVR